MRPTSQLSLWIYSTGVIVLGLLGSEASRPSRWLSADRVYVQLDASCLRREDRVRGGGMANWLAGSEAEPSTTLTGQAAVNFRRAEGIVDLVDGFKSSSSSSAAATKRFLSRFLLETSHEALTKAVQDETYLANMLKNRETRASTAPITATASLPSGKVLEKLAETTQRKGRWPTHQLQASEEVDIQRLLGETLSRPEDALIGFQYYSELDIVAIENPFLSATEIMRLTNSWLPCRLMGPVFEEHREYVLFRPQDDYFTDDYGSSFFKNPTALEQKLKDLNLKGLNELRGIDKLENLEQDLKQQLLRGLDYTYPLYPSQNLRGPVVPYRAVPGVVGGGGGGVFYSPQPMFMPQPPPAQSAFVPYSVNARVPVLSDLLPVTYNNDYLDDYDDANYDDANVVPTYGVPYGYPTTINNRFSDRFNNPRRQRSFGRHQFEVQTSLKSDYAFHLPNDPLIHDQWYLKGPTQDQPFGANVLDMWAFAVLANRSSSWRKWQKISR